MSTVETVTRRFFCSYMDQVQVRVPEGQTVGQDEFPLAIRFFKQKQSRSPVDDSVAVFERNLVGLKSFHLNYSNIKRLSSRTAYTTLFSDTLSSLGVPQLEQPDIIHKIFCLVDETLVPVLQVDIRICDITEYFTENNIRVDNDESILIDTVVRESMETYRVRLRPATKSSIEGLEKLRLFHQSLELQAIVEHTPSCPICMEPLGCLDTEEDEEAMPKQKRKRQEEETRPKKRRINGEVRPQDERNSNYEEDEVEARPKKRTIKEEARPQDKRNCEENKEEEEDARPQQLSKSNKKEAVDDDHPRVIIITRLPCLHHYHGDCIAHWLEINHVCPMCRYPMPVAETAEASKPY